MNNAHGQQVVHYLLSKLSGAGIAMFLFMFILIFVNTGFDMYETVDSIFQLKLLYLFYVYGIACSIVIDLIARLIPRMDKLGKALLYVIAGYTVFIVNGFNGYTIIAGTVGAVSALIFYAGTQWSKLKSPVKYAFSIAFPLLLGVVLNIDFTVKKGWTEKTTNTTFEANFTYFNGKHEIPVVVREGQTLSYSVEVSNKERGGYGYSLIDENGEHIGVRENVNGKLKYYVTLKKTAEYRFVVTGNGLRGAIKVEWAIE
ncbi:hypothetical protein [Paenibacillus sp. Soil724D2]|uniref:hypothetical protein n=1 Tax=Paenibacillus sp. (strain Soil724D2) TaxID=1736392 RepID=UPI000712BA03|nr:hypothetical protein [Paenibacillus sp. Soil724D2]KRE32860.1 hypothetical protein ASG85_15215 [Paenibacillus sp. Soil724D2]